MTEKRSTIGNGIETVKILDSHTDGSETQGKGASSSAFCAFAMKHMNSIGISNAYHSHNAFQLEFKVTAELPFAIVVSNNITRDIAERFTLQSRLGHNIPSPLVEYFFVPDTERQASILVSEDHLEVLHGVDSELLEEAADLAVRANDFLVGCLHGAGLSLHSSRFSFGLIEEPVDEEEVEEILLIRSPVSLDYMEIVDARSGAYVGSQDFPEDVSTQRGFDLPVIRLNSRV